MMLLKYLPDTIIYLRVSLIEQFGLPSLPKLKTTDVYSSKCLEMIELDF